MATYTTAGLAESIRRRWPLAVMAYIDHPDAEARLWSGTGTLIHGGHEWQGVGRLGRISGIGGSKRLTVRRLTFSFSGVPPEAARWLNRNVRNRPAKAWFAGLRPDGRVNGEPWMLVNGTCDYQDFEPSQGGVEINLYVTEPIWSIERALNLAYTPQWLKGRYGADVGGLDDIPGMRNRIVNWERT